MLTLDLQQAARWVDGAVHYCGQPDEVRFQGLATDTRVLPAGALFIALCGERFDGHEFLPVAQARGAAGALVSRLQPDRALPQIVVPDTLIALGRLAAGWRQHFRSPLIALTGSNGKTTVKEMLASILAAGRPESVLATRGNLNNHIGVPLTLGRLGSEDYAVIEMGANHAGEIAYLTALACPDVALITNAGPAHLEGFGSLDGVARAKGEIYAGLSDEGIAVINAEDAYADYWRSLNRGRTLIDFGLHRPARVRGELLPGFGNRFRLDLDEAVVEIRLPLAGRHNVLNALAAAAAAYAVGVTPERIRDGLQRMQAVQGRLGALPGPYGSTLFDDTYNANPASLEAGLAALTAESGPHWLVLGDMAELGIQAEELHAAAGRLARRMGIERLFTLGPLSALAATAFGADARAHADLPPLLDNLRAALVQAVAPPRMLIKGSRSMRMERVVEALRAERTTAAPVSAGEGDAAC